MLRSLPSLRPKLTYANVMATVAVFIVLGGSAYATHTHKMGTRDLKNGAVTTKKLKDSAVKRRKIANGAVNNAKLHRNSKARWAVFSGGAAKPSFRGRGVVDVTRLDAGRYDVTFNRDPRDCATFASLSPFTSDGRFIGVGNSDTGGPNDVRVQTRNSSGALADVGSIQVLVVC